MKRRRPSKSEQERQGEERRLLYQEQEEQKRRRRGNLGIKLPEPLKPWTSVDTLSKKVIPYFEKGEHSLMVAKKPKANPSTVRSYYPNLRGYTYGLCQASEGNCQTFA